MLSVYTPLTRLFHASYMPLTRLLHASYTCILGVHAAAFAGASDSNLSQVLTLLEVYLFSLYFYFLSYFIFIFICIQILSPEET
jgi:hypothetical protein